MTSRKPSRSARTSAAPWQAYRNHHGCWYVQSRHGQFLATMATGDERIDGPNARTMAASNTLAHLVRQIRDISESLNYEDGDDEGRLAAYEDALDRIRELAYKGLKAVGA